MIKAEQDRLAREVALKEINSGKGLQDFKTVAGTKFAKDFEVAGVGIVTVRVDIVIPKLEEGENTQTLHDGFMEEQAVKEQNNKQKEIAKQKKIAKDKEKREKLKAQKEQATN